MRTLCLCSLLAVCVCTVTTLLVITCIGSMHVDQLDPRRGAPKRQICPHCDTIVALRKASFATERNKRSRQHNKHPNKVFERWAASRSEELMRVTERLYSTEAERQRVSSPGVHEPACVGRLCAPYKTQAKSAERSCPPTALTGGLPAGEIAVPVPPRYFSPDLKLESDAPESSHGPKYLSACSEAIGSSHSFHWDCRKSGWSSPKIAMAIVFYYARRPLMQTQVHLSVGK